MTEQYTSGSERIDPNSDRCPWCGYPRRWRGQHAAAKHPEEWAAFKEQFRPEQSMTTEWVPKEAHPDV